MSLVLLDTNLASALFRGDREELLERYADVLVPGPLAVALQTSAEMRFGAERACWQSARLARLEAFLEKLLVLTPDQPTALRWAQLMAHAERVGRRLSVSDAWVAAAAIRDNLPLLTHDRDLHALGFAGLEVICRV